MKGRTEMVEFRKTFYETIEVIDQKPLYFFDFERIQVAPQRPVEFEDFQSLSLSERQALLEKLINRVKSL
jgi:hypothetical protein